MIKHLPTVSRRVTDKAAAAILTVHRIIAIDVIPKFETTTYGATNAPNLENETQMAWPKVLNSVGKSSGVATHVAF